MNRPPGDRPTGARRPTNAGYDGPADGYDGQSSGYDGPSDGYHGTESYDGPSRYDGPTPETPTPPSGRLRRV